MEFFYFTRSVSLQLNKPFSQQVALFEAPDQQECEASNIPVSLIYCSTPTHVRSIANLARHALESAEVETILPQVSQRLILHDDFPKAIDFDSLRDEQFVALQEKTYPIRGKAVIKVAILNGMGEAIGDSLVGLRALEIFYCQLKQDFPTVEIDLFQKNPPKNRDIYEKYTFIHKCKQLPCKVTELFDYDGYVDLSSITERTEFNDRPLIDFYLTALSIKTESIPDSEKRLSLQLNMTKREQFANILHLHRQADTPLLLFNPQASATIRSIPEGKVEACVTQILQHTSATIVLLKNPDFSHPRVLDLSAYSYSTDDYMTLVSLMDAIVTVDTSTYHIGDCFSIPSLALFTTIEPDFRVRYYPHCRGFYLGDKADNLLYGKHKSLDMKAKAALEKLWENVDWGVLLSQFLP